MLTLSDEYQKHFIKQTIENKLSEIENALKDKSYNENQINSLIAYQQLFIIIRTNLTSKNLPLVPTKILDQLNYAINCLSFDLLLSMDSSYHQYQDLMSCYKQIPTIEKKSEIKETLNQIIKNFYDEQTEISTTIESEIAKFKSLQEEEFNSWRIEKNAMQKEITSLREENDEIKNQIENFNQEIQEQKEIIAELIEKFKKDYSANSNNFKERFDNHVTDYNNKINELLSNKEMEADKTLNHLEKRKDEVEKLYGIIGQAAISGNSQNYANKAKKTADIMMGITLGIMIIVVLVLSITTFIDLYSGNFNYVHFIYKIVGSSILLVPALYCSNISKRHRDREFQLRDFEVKTAALEPFMENMILENTGDEQNINKDMVKLELTKAFFDKQFQNSTNYNDYILIPKELARILNSVAKKCNLNITLGDKNE